MYHVSRFWPFVTILYITKMHLTSGNCFFLFLNSFWSKKSFCCDLTTQTSFFDLKMRSPVQKLIWNLYFLFYHRFRHPKFSPKISLRVSIATKKIYQTFSFWIFAFKYNFLNIASKIRIYAIFTIQFFPKRCLSKL